jgi:hypothetical protein
MNYESGCSVLKLSQVKFPKISICTFFTHAPYGMGMCKKIKKSRELAENHIFYDLAEFAPPNNPFDNSNPTTPRIGTNLFGSAAGAPNPQDRWRK